MALRRLDEGSVASVNQDLARRKLRGTQEREREHEKNRERKREKQKR